MRCSGIINDEKGVAMPLVLMLMVVLTLLSTTLWFYSMNDVLQVQRDQDRTQAHYLAASGAGAMGQYIIHNPEDLDIGMLISELDGKGPSIKIPIDTAFLGHAGEMDVEVASFEKTENGEVVTIVELTGKGYVNGVEQQVTLFIEKLMPSSLYRAALEVNSSVDLDGVKIHSGPLISSGNVDISEKHGREYCDDNNYYCNTDPGLDPGPFEIIEREPFNHITKTFDPRSNESEFEEDDIEISNSTEVINSDRIISSVTLNNKGILEIDNSAHSSTMKIEIDTLVINNGGELIIKTNDVHPVYIYINDLMDLQSDITIEGFGKVYFYIRNEARLQRPLVVESNANLEIYLEKNSELSLLANATLNAYIYGPEATVRSHSAQSTVYGAIIANSYVGSQDHQDPAGELIYVPYDYDDGIEQDFGYKVSYWSR